MEYTKSEAYDRQFLLDNMMGPNAMKILEELTQLPEMLELKSQMHVLDLGCGQRSYFHISGQRVRRAGVCYRPADYGL